MRAEPFGDVSPGEVPEPASPAGPRAARPAGSRAAATPNPQPAPRAPIVDVFDEGAEILVVAELPGAADDDVTCTLAATPEGTMLHIAATCAQPYRKTIALPVGIDHSSLRQACRNGILEVRLKRAAP
jgi:HSP20 family molecular chaperone IbpA